MSNFSLGVIGSSIYCKWIHSIKFTSLLYMIGICVPNVNDNDFPSQGCFIVKCVRTNDRTQFTQETIYSWRQLYNYERNATYWPSRDSRCLQEQHQWLFNDCSLILHQIVNGCSWNCQLFFMDLLMIVVWFVIDFQWLFMELLMVVHWCFDDCSLIFHRCFNDCSWNCQWLLFGFLIVL